MTYDTMKALELIKPISSELGFNVYADDNYMYIKGTYLREAVICITANSTYATLNEFIGVLILLYNKNFRFLNLSDEQENAIRNSWKVLD